MHIPDGVLSNLVIVTTGILAAGGVANGLRQIDYERIPRVAMLAAVFFVASLNHGLLLNGLMGFLIGWAAFPALLVALLLQAILFELGGITSLGANILNMALPAVAVYYLFAPRIDRSSSQKKIFGLAFSAGVFAILLTCFFEALTLLASGKEFIGAITAFVVVHIPVMIIEGVITGLVMVFLQKNLKQLQRLKADLHSQIPLIGGWLRREAARTLVEDGSPEALSALTEALIRSNDSKVHGIALKAFLKWAEAGNPEAQDVLCRLVIERDETGVRKIVLAEHYTPRDITQRALFYLLTEQWEKYEQLDFDQHLLKTAYQGLNPTVRKRIAECMRRAGRVEWLTVIAEERQKKRLSDMTEEEWEVALAMFRKNQNWEEAWQLAQVAPAVWSVRLLQQLKKAEWMPKQEVVRTMFTRLVKLAENCNKKGAEILTTSMECYATLKGNSRDLEALAISPDGKILVSCKGKTVRVWSLPDGTLLKPLKGSKERITCLAISPDSRLLASSGGRLLDKGQFWIQVWNLLDGTVRHTLKGHTQKTTCLAMSPDGERLVSGSEDHTVCVWNLADGQLLHTLAGWSTSLSVTHQITTHNGQLLAERLNDGILTNSRNNLWLLPEEVRLPALEGFSTLSWCLALSPDKRIIVASRTALFNRSGRRDRIVRLWNLSDGSVLHDLDGHTNAITSLAFSPDGKLLVSGGYDKTIRLWSLAGGELLHTLNVRQSYPTCIAVSPDGRLLASGNQNGTIQLWTLDLFASKRLFFRPTGLEDIKVAENILQAGRINAPERKWLEFTLELMRWQRRFDVELGEAPKHIPAGKFDIEIGA